MLLCQSSNHVTVLFLDCWNFFSKCPFFNCLLNYVALLSNFPDENTLKVLKIYGNNKNQLFRHLSANPPALSGINGIILERLDCLWTLKI